MSPPALILLPGLDGSGELFGPFLAVRPPGLDVRPLRLPSDRPRGYAELNSWLCESIGTEPLVLLGESFSGPLVLMAAARRKNVAGVVLVQSFVRAPFASWLSRLPQALLGGSPPLSVTAWLLSAGDRELARRSRDAAGAAGQAVIAARVSALLRVDVSRELTELSRPLLCIQGSADRLLPARCLRRILELRPDAEVARLAGPHMILQKRPEQAWRALEPFLGRVARASERDHA